MAVYERRNHLIKNTEDGHVENWKTVNAAKRRSRELQGQGHTVKTVDKIVAPIQARSFKSPTDARRTQFGMKKVHKHPPNTKHNWTPHADPPRE